MKLLKLIPAAAIALTAFMSLEGKTEQVCMYNNASYVVDELVVSGLGSGAASKNTSSFSLGITKCIKLGDVPVPYGSGYTVKYNIEAGSCDCYGTNCVCTCESDSRNNQVHNSSNSGKTWTYEITGTSMNSRCNLQ